MVAKSIHPSIHPRKGVLLSKDTVFHEGITTLLFWTLTDKTRQSWTIFAAHPRPPFSRRVESLYFEGGWDDDGDGSRTGIRSRSCLEPINSIWLGDEGGDDANHYLVNVMGVARVPAMMYYSPSIDVQISPLLSCQTRSVGTLADQGEGELHINRAHQIIWSG